jgi:hypothetical protein
VRRHLAGLLADRDGEAPEPGGPGSPGQGSEGGGPAGIACRVLAGTGAGSGRAAPEPGGIAASAEVWLRWLLAILPPARMWSPASARRERGATSEASAALDCTNCVDEPAEAANRGQVGGRMPVAPGDQAECGRGPHQPPFRLQGLRLARLRPLPSASYCLPRPLSGPPAPHLSGPDFTQARRLRGTATMRTRRGPGEKRGKYDSTD